jgi:hypothetical protein
MGDEGNRTGGQLREDRETVARQRGATSKVTRPPIEDSGAAAPRVAEEAAREADADVRHKAAESIKEGVKKLVGAD